MSDDHPDFASERLDSSSFVPLYLQVANLLAKHINDGTYKPGRRLPSENDLIGAYGISRTTAINALQHLVEERVAFRKRGKGTFVAAPVIGKFSFFSSFSEDMRKLGLRPATKLLVLQKQSPPPVMVEKLRMPDEEYYRLLRLRFANEEPMALQDTYLPCRLYPNLEGIDFNKRYLFEVMRREYGLIPTWAEAIVEAVVVTEEQANLIKIKKGAPALLFWHLTSDGNHVRLEYVRSLYRADRFSFSTGRNRVAFGVAAEAESIERGFEQPS